MGVALTPNIVPEVGKAQFTLGENEMEIGMGIHGEPGIRRGPLRNADAIVEEMMQAVLSDLPYGSGDRVAVLINGLGATPREELYIIHRKVDLMLRERGISVFRVYVGEYATSLEMAGASVSLLRLDDELATLLARPARTPFFQQA
jgi:phosphoenolpyruvate---glycerone phosphotransferase subunit DhaK